ncbi:extracellular solute-binding protein [Streptomyces litchfieldiae]|uniref:Extracellular solute-binding protein n=1 Tax=Streptomyces litchfieldiae TaxID=3075543 RepID=A0ABU2MVV1_9ACTN|nr:extracellular solute-binding protein [Streptomyces sp. DSM 44938]MDT0345771.1 extracellular solute-binding protein [Streptomyces sp. DSM 44938]
MHTSLSRRRLLGAGAASLIAAPALAGCGTSQVRSASNVGADPVPWPEHIPFDGPEPDLPPDPRGVDAGFLRYPDRLTTSVPEKPGTGRETVTALVETYEAPPLGPGSNQYWAALNDALGVDLRLRVVPSGNMGHKIATMMASGDMPDLMLVRNWMPRVADYAVNAAQDLSEFLAGDRIRDYPNLANLPTYAWQDMGLMAGRIQGVPIVRPRTGSTVLANQEAMSEAAQGRYNDWTGEELVDALVRATGDGHYGFGSASGGWLFGAPLFASWFGAPNMYRVDDAGNFVKAEATEEYRAAIEFATRLHQDEKVYYPGAATLATETLKSMFFNGTVRSHVDNLPGYQAAVTAVRDEFTVDLLRAPTGLGRGPVSHFSGGTYGYTLFKPAAPDRIRLLLRVLDFLAAPFGTTEYELTYYGVEGAHFTRGDGDLELTELAQRENPSVVPVKYITAPPPVHFFPGNPEAARRAHAFQVADVEMGIPPLTSGLVVREARVDQNRLRNVFFDAAVSVIQGHSPISRWDDAVRRWRTDGGDRIDAELQREYEAVHGS